MVAADQSSALPRALTHPEAESRSPTFLLALLGAGLLHLFLVLAVTFEMPKPGQSRAPEEALEILILKDQGIATDSPDADAALSQRSRFGESNQGDGAITMTEAEVLPLEELTEPFEPGDPVAPEEFAPEAEPPTRRSEGTLAEVEVAPEPETAETLDLETPPEPLPEPEILAPEPDPTDPLEALPAPAVDTAQILGSRNEEIARLTASLEARTAAYASRQRRKSVSASTREFRYASYLGAWARKVERIGNLNYPQAAKEQHIYGSLILHVAVRNDGSVEAIRVVRSSGHDLLDQAAVDIVQLAAPYAPFPPEIAAETDVLDIIRTWQFQRGGKLGWEQ